MLVSKQPLKEKDSRYFRSLSMINPWDFYFGICTEIPEGETKMLYYCADGIKSGYYGIKWDV